MQLTGLGRATKLKHLWQAPFTLHKQILRAIQNEATNAEAGRGGRIIAKMNALVEPEVIGALYAASKAGVQIDLIVRGVCALRPGVAGSSENIRVRSIIGRFLEHSRVFYFQNGGEDNVYLSSADWMGRNFFGRVEICFPVLDAALKKRVIDEGLTCYLDDNAAAWCMDEHGHYQLPQTKGKANSAQQTLLDRLASK
jgi:polyphosphate kinase